MAVSIAKLSDNFYTAVSLESKPDYSLDHPVLTVSVPGTCGELIQGWFMKWQEPVLLSCPIDYFNQIRVRILKTPDIVVTSAGQYPCQKIRQAAQLALQHFGCPDLGVCLEVLHQIPVGRGMASSTADIVAVLAGVATALGQEPGSACLAQLACQIEPSDSTMFMGATLLAYRGNGRGLEFPSLPPLPLLMLDPEKAVDTQHFNNSLNLDALQRLALSTETALKLLQRGLLSGDDKAIGMAATLSALSYQMIKFNPFIRTAIRWAAETGAIGVIRAHSGSVTGLLYPLETDLGEPIRRLSRRFKGSITQTRMSPGGHLIFENTPNVQPLKVRTAR
ncbi:MAG: hypothetical protein R3264_09065 [Anaerolineae bacterium]|nr:hypothetical protein [Anaerolineae bacterium]